MERRYTPRPERARAGVDRPGRMGGHDAGRRGHAAREIAGQVALDELVLHAWDLARGTGQPYQQDPATLEACLAAMTGMYPPDDLDARKGIFEPPVPVPDDAPLVDRVVAYSGRDPGWPGR